MLAALMASADLCTAGIAKYAGEFMSTGVGARALGMGGAYVAVGGDVTFGVWNPAGLSKIGYPELSAMHSRRFGGVVNYDYAGFAVPFRSSEGLGLSVIRLAVDDIPYTALPRPDLPIDLTFIDGQGNLVANRPYISKTVNDAEYAFYLSYARARDNDLSYGTNVKFIHKGVGDNSAWGIGFDVGILWNPVGRLKTGINVQDITTTLLAWDTGKKELISPTMKTGVAYPFTFSFLTSQLLLAADADIRFEGRDFSSQWNAGTMSLDFHLGVELLLKNVIALRLGSDMGNLAAGAGLRLPKLDFDYAFLSHDDLGVTHRVSLRLRIEEEKFARK